MEVPVEHHPVRQLLPSMRWLLLAAGVLVTLAGVQLYLFPLRTDRWFAWTISPPMTAVFLGGAYWSSAAFEWTGARARTWADARIAVPTVFVFTTTTLVVTLVHIDKFHLRDEHGFSTRLVTWIWIAVYAIVPVLMLVIWVGQVRVPGIDPARTRPLSRTVVAVVAAQSALFLLVGTWMLAAPEDATWWPWAVTPLTGRAIGAWVLSLGVAAGHAVLERDAVRLRPAAAADVAFAVLQGIALLRHGGDLDWGRPSAWAFVAVLVVMAWIGVRTIVAARSPRAGLDATLDPAA
ncbi:hypothetical protein [Dermatobacter hominis]|uniref:hypothetical protein n=1 Tax=Dermatobacter hominis TaxID=2884263 RepID=UPI001D109610|nr:hypothetical protein [Dermatobacter hominis]UDY36475.1 hypothetical protein LH044_02810 [Dermatobacter hominis]